MTTSFRGYWRQSGLCFLTFVIGIAVAMAWQNVWHEAGISNGVPQVPAATAPAAPSEHWNIILTLIVMAALAAIVLAVGFRLAAEQRSTSASSTTASDSRHATLVATPISAVRKTLSTSETTSTGSWPNWSAMSAVTSIQPRIKRPFFRRLKQIWPALVPLSRFRK